MGVMIAYWHKEGLDIYGIVNKRPVKLAAGSLDKLSPVKKITDRKILIVGRERLLHIKKRYPPAPEDKLKKAVGMEIGDITPIANPAHYCQIFESFSSHVMMDIWAWETDQYERLKEIFPFSAAVPEDLVFASAAPEITLYPYHGTMNLLAHGGGKFFAGASFPADSFTPDDLERFIQGLTQYHLDIKKMKIYGTMPFYPGDHQLSEITNAPLPLYPPCLDYFESLDLKKFRVKRDYRLLQKKDLFLRIFIYLILGYALALFLTSGNYDRASAAVRQKISAIDNQVSTLSADRQDAGDSMTGIAKELSERLAAGPSALAAMTTLARRLPAGSFITRMVFNENNTDVAVSSKDPLSVVRALGDAAEIKKVSLKGPPVKDRTTALYHFNMTIEFIRQ